MRLKEREGVGPDTRLFRRVPTPNLLSTLKNGKEVKTSFPSSRVGVFEFSWIFLWSGDYKAMLQKKSNSGFRLIMWISNYLSWIYLHSPDSKQSALILAQMVRMATHDCKCSSTSSICVCVYIYIYMGDRPLCDLGFGPFCGPSWIHISSGPIVLCSCAELELGDRVDRMEVCFSVENFFA